MSHELFDVWKHEPMQSKPPYLILIGVENRRNVVVCCVAALKYSKNNTAGLPGASKSTPAAHQGVMLVVGDTISIHLQG